MSLPPDYYDEVVAVYIRMINQDSPQAAEIIQQIHSAYGSRAALRATLILTILKMEAQQDHPIPDSSRYTYYMFREYPEALPLLEKAVKCWRHDRSIWVADRENRTKGNLPDARASLPPPDLPPSLDE